MIKGNFGFGVSVYWDAKKNRKWRNASIFSEPYISYPPIDVGGKTRMQKLIVPLADSTVKFYMIAVYP
jgi:hypothetical protein